MKNSAVINQKLLPSFVFKSSRMKQSFPKPSCLKQLVFKQQSGFTLIELLVVIMIIGLLITMAAMSVSTSSDKGLETEAKRFATLMKLASDESVMNVRPIAAQIGKQSYQFSVAGEVESEDPIFRPREVSDHIHLEVTIEEEKVDFESLEKDAFANIYILPSGEMTPFSVIFYQDDGAAYEVVGDFFSKIEFVGRVESPSL